MMINQWISCADRFPEEGEDVLMQFDNNMAVGFYVHGYWHVICGDGIHFEKQCFYHGSGHYGGGAISND